MLAGGSCEETPCTVARQRGAARLAEGSGGVRDEGERPDDRLLHSVARDSGAGALAVHEQVQKVGAAPLAPRAQPGVGRRAGNVGWEVDVALRQPAAVEAKGVRLRDH